MSTSENEQSKPRAGKQLRIVLLERIKMLSKVYHVHNADSNCRLGNNSQARELVTVKAIVKASEG